MKSVIVVVFVIALAVPATAQQSVVAAVKADLVARGVDLSGDCGAFAITSRVAWTLRSRPTGCCLTPPWRATARPAA